MNKQFQNVSIKLLSILSFLLGTASFLPFSQQLNSNRMRSFHLPTQLGTENIIETVQRARRNKATCFHIRRCCFCKNSKNRYQQNSTTSISRVIGDFYEIATEHGKLNDCLRVDYLEIHTDVILFDYTTITNKIGTRKIANT